MAIQVTYVDGASVRTMKCNSMLSAGKFAPRVRPQPAVPVPLLAHNARVVPSPARQEEPRNPSTIAGFGWADSTRYLIIAELIVADIARRPVSLRWCKVWHPRLYFDSGGTIQDLHIVDVRQDLPHQPAVGSVTIASIVVARQPFIVILSIHVRG